MSMLIKIWGGRGSLPAPYTPALVENKIRKVLYDFHDCGYKTKREIESYLATLKQHQLGGYGGNTACVTVSTLKQMLIIDGGSGLRLLGYELMSGPCGRGKGELHLLFTHFHWDHLMGIPFFVPLFIPGNIIHVYSVQPYIKDVFNTLFKRPFFPLALKNIPSKIVYHTLKPRAAHPYGPITVTPYQLDHPDPCWGFKFEYQGKVFSHCVDTECRRVSREELGEDLGLYQNVDLMTFDAQYTLTEKFERIDWGHGSASVGLDIAMREGIKQVVFMHHDPASSDDKVYAAFEQAKGYYQLQMEMNKKLQKHFSTVDWCFSHDGMEIIL